MKRTDRAKLRQCAKDINALCSQVEKVSNTVDSVRCSYPDAPASITYHSMYYALFFLLVASHDLLQLCGTVTDTV